MIIVDSATVTQLRVYGEQNVEVTEETSSDLTIPDFGKDESNMIIFGVIIVAVFVIIVSSIIAYLLIVK